MKQTVKKLLFMLGIMCLTIFGKETSTTVLADNLDEIENYTIYAEPDWEDGSVYLKYDITWKVLDSDTRSEERRVGKECRSRWSPYH